MKRKKLIPEGSEESTKKTEDVKEVAKAKKALSSKTQKSRTKKSGTKTPAAKIKSAVPKDRKVEKLIPSQNTGAHTVRTIKLPNEEASVIVSPSRRRKVRKTKVTLEGKLSIRNMDEIWNAVQPVFSDFDFVDFYLENPEELDITCLQMLFYAKELYEQHDKTVTVDANLSSEQLRMITDLGYKSLLIKPKLA